MARFNETVNLQPVDTRTGAAQAILSFADQLESFKQTANQAATAQAIKKGEASGIASAEKRKRNIQAAETRVSAASARAKELADTPGAREEAFSAFESAERDLEAAKTAPELKKEGFFGSTAAIAHNKALKAGHLSELRATAKQETDNINQFAAHNKALRAAYMSSIKNDITEAVTRIEQENADSTLRFNDAADGYIKGVMSGVDTSVRDEVANYLDSKIIASRGRVRKANLSKDKKEALGIIDSGITEAGNNAASSAFNGDDSASADSLLDATILIDEAVLAGAMTEAQGKERLHAIKQEKAEQEITHDLNILAAESLQLAQDKISELETTVPKGWTPDEWRSFTISAQQDLNRKAARVKKAIVEDVKAKELEDSTTRGIAFMNPDVAADPKDKQDREDINNAFEAISPEWAGLPPADQAKNILGFIKNTGMMPDPVVSTLNATMRSGNIEQTISSALLITEISKDPFSANIMKELPDETRALASQVSNMVALGIEPEQAVAIARDNTFGKTEAERQQIKTQTQIIKPELQDKLVDRKDDDPHYDPGFFTTEPDITPTFQAEFDVTFEKFMTLTNGDSEVAFDLAYDNMKKTWATSRIGGDTRLMKYAPEAIYAQKADPSHDWMVDQFESDMESAGFDPDDVLIAVDFETSRQGLPEWALMAPDENGVIGPVLTEQGVARWKPDFTQTQLYKKLSINPEKKKQMAVKSRERLDLMKKATKGGFKPTFVDTLKARL